MENQLVAVVAEIVNSLEGAEFFDEFSAHAALLSVRQELAEALASANTQTQSE